jgi:hypothetical protein
MAANGHSFALQGIRARKAGTVSTLKLLKLRIYSTAHP